jgi:hypothetical protein
MKEEQLQNLIVEACNLLHLRTYHTYDSRRSNPGWPDMVIVGPRGMIIRELKTEKGKVSHDQEQWLCDLAAVGLDVGVWRPSDWPDTVMAELQQVAKKSYKEMVGEKTKDDRIKDLEQRLQRIREIAAEVDRWDVYQTREIGEAYLAESTQEMVAEILAAAGEEKSDEGSH